MIKRQNDKATHGFSIPISDKKLKLFLAVKTSRDTFQMKERVES